MQIYPRKVSIVEDEKSFNQLIILGNGFDLACGLKSTYRDFFDYILYKKEAENNYWYFVFQSLNSRNRLNNNWTDIERQILVELKNIEFLYKKGIFKKGELNVRSKASDFVNSLSESPEDYSLRVTALAAASAIQQHYFEIPSKKELQTHLIKKILLLEEHFCNYLNEQIEIEQSHIDDYFINNGRSTSMNISSDINIIKFYGHGLGEADYSYFQAIFDSVDLYHSNTKIVFYWSDYQGVEKQAIRVEQVKNVTKLIEEYGTTFTNKDHGRNLLTKLQLENRLQIEEIPIEELLQYVN
ncbi:hypothetical protein GTP07_08705 [Lactococcus lactis]|nr:hypothetical protein [Lactococcus lactis]